MSKAIMVLMVTLTGLFSAPVLAGPAEDANLIVDRWAVAYSNNDTDALTRLYAPQAILLGTTSPIISDGADGIREYFKDMPGSGRMNIIEERHGIVLNDHAVVVTGFYNFFRREQPGIPRPSRFTMVVVNNDGQWVIIHHHSSPRASIRQ